MTQDNAVCCSSAGYRRLLRWHRIPPFVAVAQTACLVHNLSHVALYRDSDIRPCLVHNLSHVAICGDSDIRSAVCCSGKHGRLAKGGYKSPRKVSMTGLICGATPRHK
ncbi:MAG: hypothetical protein GDA45_05675 [Chromatiales bacterium]|nr:hypothetical protein [Chromatiales bacterium]